MIDHDRHVQFIPFAHIDYILIRKLMGRKDVGFHELEGKFYRCP